MSIARFKVMGELDGAGGRSPGTVEIDRETGMLYVRRKGKRRRYSMPLGVVATMVCRAEILSEMREAKASRPSRGRKAR